MLFFFFFKAAVSTVNSCGFEDLSACDTQYLVFVHGFSRRNSHRDAEFTPQHR